MLVRISVPFSLRIPSIDRTSPGLQSRIFAPALSTVNPSMIWSKSTMGISEDSQFLYDLA